MAAVVIGLIVFAILMIGCVACGKILGTLFGQAAACIMYVVSALGLWVAWIYMCVTTDAATGGELVIEVVLQALLFWLVLGYPIYAGAVAIETSSATKKSGEKHEC
jgi:uncharacterized membrane protein